MKELQDIIRVWKKVRQEGQTAALATLVKVEGSAYRSPGARMLIISANQQIGTISGGCLENDVVKRSLEVLKTGIPTLVKYDTTSEDDLIWGLGLGCQGIAYILIERLNNDDELDTLEVIEQCLSHRQLGASATVFSVQTSTNQPFVKRLLLYPDGNVVSNINNSELKKMVETDLQLVLKEQKSRSLTYKLGNGKESVFLEAIVPPIHLIIFGAGFDALPVVCFAKALGWYVTIIDPQGRSQTTKRFDRCDRVILTSADEATSQIEFDSETVVVTMSHNYLYDLEFLQTLNKIELKYLGILGPKKRTNRLLKDLNYEGFIDLPQQIYSPVGLDIGANNPEEIALSIIAEIQAVTQSRTSGFLKDRNAPIHSPTPEFTSKNI